MDKKLDYVHIESSTICNAKCRMCPHSTLTRKGTMDYDLFVSIVDQAVELGCQTFTLFRLGEPLLFPDLFQWMDYLRKKQVKISLYTNASALVPSISRKLKDYSDIFSDFSISFHGIDKESYESMMGLDFDHVRNRIQEFMKDNPIKVNIYSLTEDVHDQVYRNKFKALWGGMGFVGIGTTQFMEWGGSIEGLRTFRTMKEEGATVKIVPCIRVIHEIDVMYDGTVVLCCLDAHGEITFGNLRHDSLEKVLNHKLRQYYQEKHLSGDSEELPLCKYCSTKMVVVSNG